MRKITLDNPKLAKILKDRKPLFEDIQKINKKIEELDKKRTSLSYRMNNLKDRTATIIEKETPSFKLGEFEVIANVSIESGTPEVEIIDQIEEFKAAIREKASEKK